jgi:hypothetical protein
MKLAPMLAVLLAVATGSHTDNGDLEKIVKDKVKSLQDIVAALKTATDSKTAQTALMKMEVALERLIVCDEVLADQKVFDLLHKDKLDAKYDKQLADANSALQAELMRLSKQPELIQVIEKDAGWQRWQTVLREHAELHAAMHKNKIIQARIDVKSLEQAVAAYEVKNGQRPLSLQILAEKQADGGPAYIKDTLLRDPWRQLYIYEPNTLHPNTGVPLIMSQGPPGQKMPIRNWDPK